MERVHTLRLEDIEESYKSNVSQLYSPEAHKEAVKEFQTKEKNHYLERKLSLRGEAARDSSIDLTLGKLQLKSEVRFYCIIRSHVVRFYSRFILNCCRWLIA